MKFNYNGVWKNIPVKASDTYPIGGTTRIPDDMPIPDGWEEVEDEVVLFEGYTTQGYGIEGEITLNDDASNYKYLEIYFDRYGYKKYIKTDAVNGGNIVLDTQYLGGDYIRLYSQIRNITGNKISVVNEFFLNINTSGTAISQIGLVSNISIYKVVGIR